MGDVGSARYEPALLPPYPTIRVLNYSNCQKFTHSISKVNFQKSSASRVNRQMVFFIGVRTIQNKFPKQSISATTCQSNALLAG